MAVTSNGVLSRSGRRPERIVFVAHGVVTLAAAVVLAVSPAAIPAAAGIVIGPGEFLLSYFVAAAELAIAVISVGAARLADPAAIRLIAGGFALFHLATAALEVVHLARIGPDVVVIANVVLRVLACGVFLLILRARRA